MSQRSSDERLIRIHRRRLEKLKEQQAIQGHSVDPKIPMEIEDIELELESLRATRPDHVIDVVSSSSSTIGAKSRDVHRAGREVVTILFLAANPLDTLRLRLDAEVQSIDRALRQAEFRDLFDLKQHWAVRVTDLSEYLLRHRPDIVHFSGHGSISSEIILEGESGSKHPVSVRALSRLFSVLEDNIRCVVLNACYSERQGQAIAEHVDCVVGTSQTIGDSSAISFAAAFYMALGYGKNVKTAFDLGCVQIDLERLDEQNSPRLFAVRSNPEEIVFVHE